MLSEVSMSHRRSTVKGSLSFANPTVRAWLFQILAVVAVIGIVGWLFHNTVTNLSNRGITSGLPFWIAALASVLSSI